MLMEFFENYARNYQPYKDGAWCYEDGCVYRGLELLYKATGEQRWFDHIIRMVDAQIESGPKLVGYDPNEYNIDNIKAGGALLFLHKETGEDRYLEAAGCLVRQLKTHPRTHSGVYWHKLRYPWQIWLDGLYMGPPFQIGYGLATGDDALVQDSLTQIETAMSATFVPKTGLYAHAFDEARAQPWADPQTGQSPTVHWARALGWLAMALIDVRELVGTERFAPFSSRTQTLLQDIASFQQDDGLWLQVIDEPQLAGNYKETSASAMFVYAILRARDFGLYDGPTEGMLKKLVGRSVQKSSNGGFEMTEICHVAGLGTISGRYRDGSAAYYVSEVCVSDDAKGVAPLMMAVATDIRQRATQEAAQVAS